MQKCGLGRTNAAFCPRIKRERTWQWLITVGKSLSDHDCATRTVTILQLPQPEGRLVSVHWQHQFPELTKSFCLNHFCCSSPMNSQYNMIIQVLRKPICILRRWHHEIYSRGSLEHHHPWRLGENTEWEESSQSPRSCFVTVRTALSACVIHQGDFSHFLSYPPITITWVKLKY